MIEFPFRTTALKIEQPLGLYYVAVLPAELLLNVCFSDRLKAHKEENGTYVLGGTQRAIDPKRLKAIGGFISRSDAAFPNSIILAANLRGEDGFIEEDAETRWSIEPDEPCGASTITIPTTKRLSAVIDGQHRLFSFAYASPSRLSMPLVCSIFFDLPKPFQAQLFATINSTQKPVDKSLTYELFGYNISEESESFWSPDKVAVFFARKLNTEEDSPLRDRIAIAPENDFNRLDDGSKPKWQVSMATVVEGILRLISSNPKQDSNELLDPAPQKRQVLAGSDRGDNSALRSLYLEENDKLLYLIVVNYLKACKVLFWDVAGADSFIVKTVGVQALFDVLRDIAPEVLTTKNASAAFFTNRLAPAKDIDFSAAEFRNASGSGRTQIKRAIEHAIGIV